jgi:phage terminase large subunit GpA-like protein
MADSTAILMKMFAGGFLRLAGANSPSSLASMSIRAYFGDEIDKYPASAGKEGDPVKLAIQRTETFWNWLVFLVSTPSIKENSRIEDEFEESDQRRFFVPCPHCGHKQHLVWSSFQYANKDTGNRSLPPNRRSLSLAPSWNWRWSNALSP